MSESKRVTLLVGSPKGLERGGSASLGRAVTGGLEKLGWECNAYHLHSAARSEDVMSELVMAIDQSDLVVISTPLYVDSLPAPAIHALHKIAAHRSNGNVVRVPRFFSIVNCGFVDPWQNGGAQNMLKLFCKQARLEPVGDISLGAGGALTKKARQALALVVTALDEGNRVPDRVKELTKRRIMPGFLYVLGGNFMWKRQAKRNGVRNQLKAQPYKRT
ncbi:hypothetical protein IH601_12485 [Candidatus Bipolaricaulota bacterium]|nr:hypothetical protein [Candidatus Bipolaricaulota bacterium]TFH07994.1 MAG: hypothetical protein E4H08_08555 [Candidatus Atribacteria bacterium]